MGRPAFFGSFFVLPGGVAGVGSRGY